MVTPVAYESICQTRHLAHVQELHHMNICDEVHLHCLVGWVFVSGPEDLGSILGHVIPKTFKNGTWYLLA